MPPYLSPLHLHKPALPAHCAPENEFLYQLSATFHACIPTNLAFISTVLGTCSIVAWLFAQLPQIYKNHQLKSTSGLSIFFLAEWLLGDLSNLLGCIFTGQALWQVIIASYYVTVDCALVGQWIWYELLKHGRPLRSIWASADNAGGGNTGNGIASMQEVWEAQNQQSGGTKASPPHSPGRYIPHRSNPMDAFRIPNFARSPSSSSMLNTPTQLGTTPKRPTINRSANSSSPMLSPKTVLYISLILAVLSNSSTAKPVSPFAPSPPRLSSHNASPYIQMTNTPSSATQTAGQILSWLSTALYLLSRLPQLYKNHCRKSTAGLSPTLFLAAFFGNLFYSTSLLANPCAWHTFSPGEGRGWVSPAGSQRRDWVLRALPFFLGAAGVLVMDAAVGCQFWYFGDEAEDRGRATSRSDDEIVEVLYERGIRKRIHRRWRRASGWMRGWMPSVSVAGTPSVSRSQTPSREESPSPDSRGDRMGGRGALDEARALLGTSPRGGGRYGGI